MSCQSWEGCGIYGAEPGVRRRTGGHGHGLASGLRALSKPPRVEARAPAPRGLRFCEPWLPVSVGSGEDLGVSRNGTVAIASCPGAPTYGWVLLRRTRLWRFFVGRNRTSYEYSLLICSHA